VPGQPAAVTPVGRSSQKPADLLSVFLNTGHTRPRHPGELQIEHSLREIARGVEVSLAVVHRIVTEAAEPVDTEAV
jgi:hypothetical protein